MMFGNSEYWKAWQKANVPQAEPEVKPEAVKIDAVTGWRFGFLLGLGFDPVSSLELAHANNVDLHSAEGLIRGGCPTDVAYRILL